MRMKNGSALVCQLALAAYVVVAPAAFAAVITVDSLADDLFPSSTGTLVDLGGSPVTSAAHCTLRMALAAANLNLPIPFGGSGGCVTGSGADTIVFAGSLNLVTTPGTISLADRGMSEAPAAYVPALIIQPALIASGPLTINGPGSGNLTIDGGLPGNSGRRLLLASDGSSALDAPFSISGVRLLRGRAIEQSSGCMFSAETTMISDVIFESCESVGGPTQGGFGGALGVGNVNTVGNFRPDVTVSNVVFKANRSTRGTSTTAEPFLVPAVAGSAR